MTRIRDDLNRTPEYSIIIPTYDRPALLAQAVDSVLQQTIPDWECIIVDDCSPNPPPEFGDPRITVVRQSKNLGPGAAVNRGVSLAQGNFITRLDDDDILLPHRLELARRGLRSAHLALCLSGTLGDPRAVSKLRHNGCIAETILDQMTPHMGTVMIARDKWIPLDESYRASQDVEWWLRIAQTVRVATIPEVGYLYRQHSGSRNMNGTHARYVFNDKLLCDHTEWFSAHPAAYGFRLRRRAHYAGLLGYWHIATLSLLESLIAKPSIGALRQLLQLTMHRLAAGRRK